MASTPRRAAVACSFCRHRKRRCDGRTPQCGTCRAKGLECIYYSEAPPLTRIDSHAVDESHVQRLEAVERLLQEHSAAIAALREAHSVSSNAASSPALSRRPHEPSEAPSLSVARSAATPAMVSPPLLSNGGRSPLPFASTSWTTTTAATATTTTSRDRRAASSTPHDHDGDLAPPLTIPLGHQTTTSTLLLLPQVRSLVGSYPEELLFQIEDRRPRWSAAGQAVAESSPGGDPIPGRGRRGTQAGAGGQAAVDVDPAAASRFFESYLALVHPFHPFLDKDDLFARYDDAMRRGLGSDAGSALILAVLALGATAADPLPWGQDRDRTGAGAAGAAAHSGDAFVREATRILLSSWVFSFAGDIVVAQALILCSLYFNYTVEPLMAWRFVHMASTNIQQMLTRCKDLMSSDAEIQDMTRLSWVCFIIESDILAEFHQPRSGIEVLVDRMPFPNYGKQPTPENLYTLADISARALLNRIHNTLFPADSLTLYATRLDAPDAAAAAAAAAVSSVTAPSPSASSLLRVCQELDRQLETWYASLADEIRPDLFAQDPDDDGGSREMRVLRLRYWSSKQNIYRPFVVYVTSQTRRPDAADVAPVVLDMCEVCLSACRMFILTTGHLLSLRTPYTYTTAQCLLSCILVISMAAQSRPLRGFVEDYEALQHRAIEFLKPWAEPGTGIECAYDIACSLVVGKAAS